MSNVTRNAPGLSLVDADGVQRPVRQASGPVAPEVIATSPAMLNVLHAIELVAGTDCTVLITGETGTGKELVARAIHAASARRSQPLVTVNCAAMPKELIESELFGHERGAFTGAVQQRCGRFESADGGSIFLDEIGELPLDLQPRLLRVLQEREFERVGGNACIGVDVRVIAATNREPTSLLAGGRFRHDLFYRLNVFPVLLPPLRQRREDIALLAEHFLAGCARDLNKTFSGIEPETLQRMLRYDWPGNVRELQNLIERLAIVCDGPLLCDAGLDLFGQPAIASSADDCSASLRDITRRHIAQVLQRCGGVIEGNNGAAAVLDLKPSTLRHRMKQLGLGRPVSARLAAP